MEPELKASLPALLSQWPFSIKNQPNFVKKKHKVGENEALWTVIL